MAKTYAPKKVSVSFNGLVLSGFADGTFVEVDFNSDAFEDDVGSDGEGGRVASADESGTVKVTLQAMSASNDLLTAIAVLDRATQAATGALLVKDASGRSLHLAAEAWVKKIPQSAFAKSKGVREWVFSTIKLKSFPAGN